MPKNFIVASCETRPAQARPSYKNGDLEALFLVHRIG